MKKILISVRQSILIAICLSSSGFTGLMRHPGHLLMTNKYEISDDIIRLAKLIHKRYDILPSITLSQYLLESANGTSDLAVYANNPFGFKAHTMPGTPVYAKVTREFYNGKYKDTVQLFRKFSTLEEAFLAYGDRLSNNLIYRGIAGKSCFQSALPHLKPYSTDPLYLNKLENIFESNKLDQYDGINARAVSASDQITVFKAINLCGEETFYVQAYLKDENENIIDSKEAILMPNKVLSFSHNSVHILIVSITGRTTYYIQPREDGQIIEKVICADR